MLQDLTICDDSKDKNRTKKVFDSLDEVCYAFDLSRPIWLNTNIDEFKRNDKTRFRRDNFIDDIDFDFIHELSEKCPAKIIAEGHIHYPEQAKKALEAGAFALVVGGAITRPAEITARFVAAIEK